MIFRWRGQTSGGRSNSRRRRTHKYDQPFGALYRPAVRCVVARAIGPGTASRKQQPWKRNFAARDFGPDAPRKVAATRQSDSRDRFYPRQAHGNVGLFSTLGNHVGSRRLPGGGRSLAKPVSLINRTKQGELRFFLPGDPFAPAVFIGDINRLALPEKIPRAFFRRA